MVPDYHHEAVVYAEHLSRYLFAAPLVADKVVLDVASGSGYGADLLREAGAERVIALDSSDPAIRYGQEKHARQDPDYVIADAHGLPLGANVFDIVVCFETIEHLSDPQAFLDEIQRVLKPNGLFIVSTPNKGIYVEGNPFHLNEFTFEELTETLAARFSNVRTLTQDNWITSAIFSIDTIERDDFELRGLQTFKGSAKDATSTLYMVCLCSDAPLPEPDERAVISSAYEMKAFLQEIDRLTKETETTAQARDQLKRALDKETSATARLQRQVEQKQGEIDGVHRRLSELENSTGWRMLNRLRPIIRRLAPMGSRRRKLLYGIARVAFRLAGRLAAPFRRGRPMMTADQVRPSQKPQVNRLRVGCYGEHCWTVGGGTVHALQLLIPLAEFYDVELLLPPGTPLRDRNWYLENLLIDIGDIKVRHHTADAEDGYDIWLSVWNERIWPAPTRKRFNMVFFPFVRLDGSGWTHITNGNYSAGHLRERYNTDDIIVAYPTVNANEYKTGPKEPMILHVSRFALPSAYADKAHIMMIQAFKRLCERGLEGWKLVLAGATLDEGERTYADHLAKHSHGYPIEFALNLSAADLRDLFARSSIYWHATGFSVREAAAQEHFGITIVEGMASGAVPVSYNSGGPPEIITSGDNGYLFDTLDEMVDQTLELTNNPEKWRRLSDAARERAAYFSPTVVRKQMLDAVSKTHKVSIIMGTHNNLAVLKRAIESILQTTPDGYELIIVDNNSNDGTGTYLASLDYPHLKVLTQPDNPGFAVFNNRALAEATREYILYLNDDVEALPGWLEPLIETLDADERIGAAGSRLFYPDGRVQHDGKMFSAADRSPQHINIGGTVVTDEDPIEVDALTAACMLLRRDLAGFSEDYKHGYYEDTDLCLSIKERGYALVLHRGSVLIHYHGMTYGRDQKASEAAQERNRKLFMERWGDKLPQLTYLASEDEMSGKAIFCKSVVTLDVDDPWPLSQRLIR